LIGFAMPNYPLNAKMKKIEPREVKLKKIPDFKLGLMIIKIGRVSETQLVSTLLIMSFIHIAYFRNNYRL